MQQTQEDEWCSKVQERVQTITCIDMRLLCVAFLPRAPLSVHTSPKTIHIHAHLSLTDCLGFCYTCEYSVSFSYLSLSLMICRLLFMSRQCTDIFLIPISISLYSLCNNPVCRVLVLLFSLMNLWILVNSLVTPFRDFPINVISFFYSSV